MLYWGPAPEQLGQPGHQQGRRSHRPQAGAEPHSGVDDALSTGGQAALEDAQLALYKTLPHS